MSHHRIQAKVGEWCADARRHRRQVRVAAGPVGPIAVLATVVAIGLAGCTSAGPSPAGSHPATGPATSPAIATEAGGSAGSGPPASARASTPMPSTMAASPDPSPTASTLPVPSGSPAEPPDVLLSGLAGPEATGTLGSWTIGDRGSDSPWLPAAALTEVSAPVGGRLQARFAAGWQIATWSARRAAASDIRGERLTGLGERSDHEPPLDRVALEPLPAGRWVVAIRLDLVGGGDVTVYWLIRVS